MRRLTQCNPLAGVFLAVATVAVCPQAFGYGFWKLANGRADYQARYDYVTGSKMWPGQSTSWGGPVEVYQFGDLYDGFTYTGGTNQIGLTKIQVENGLQWAVGAANNGWEKWAKVDFGTSVGPATAKVRLAYDPTDVGAWVNTFDTNGDDLTDYAKITFGTHRATGVAWDAEHFRLCMQHELGHVLGLDDLYLNYNEDFVDHRIGETANPNRTPESLRDNIMNGPWKENSNTIDNDEIAGVTWLWGADHSQIVTGDLAESWNADDGRDVTYHHGTQPENGLTWWDYRASVVKTSAGTKPFIDLEFPGYEGFIYNAYPPVNITETALGNDKHRFTIEELGWIGNISLMVNSQYSNEQRIRSDIVTGGATDRFKLARNLNTRAYSGISTWAMPFGPAPEFDPLPQALGLDGLLYPPGAPIPEPATAMLLIGVLALLRRRRA